MRLNVRQIISLYNFNVVQGFASGLEVNLLSQDLSGDIIAEAEHHGATRLLKLFHAGGSQLGTVVARKTAVEEPSSMADTVEPNPVHPSIAADMEDGFSNAV